MNYMLILILICVSLFGCHQARIVTPEACFLQMLDSAAQNDRASLEQLISKDSTALAREYEQLVIALNAGNAPREPLTVLLLQMQQYKPELQQVEMQHKKAQLHIRYANGISGTLFCVKERREWKLDLANELASTVALLRQANNRLQLLKTARETGKAIAGVEEEDDDD